MSPEKPASIHVASAVTEAAAHMVAYAVVMLHAEERSEQTSHSLAVHSIAHGLHVSGSRRGSHTEAGCHRDCDCDYFEEPDTGDHSDTSDSYSEEVDAGNHFCMHGSCLAEEES